MVRIEIGGQVFSYSKGTSFYDIAAEHQKDFSDDILLVWWNGRLQELHHKADEDGTMSFVTARDIPGFETYRRSCGMLFLAAAYRLLGETEGLRIRQHFATDDGFFYTLHGVEVDQALTERLEAEMHKMAEEAIPFEKRTMSTPVAEKYFQNLGMEDKARLFRTRMSSSVHIYRLGSFEDYSYGHMVSNTSYLRHFALYLYKGGIVLQMPERQDPDHVKPLESTDKLFSVQRLGEWHSASLMVPDIGMLNERIVRGDTRDMILTAEARQEAYIAEIALRIAEKPSIKVVLIAGPSSSGKTTFSQRLSIQMQAMGLHPHYVGMDNYFKNRDDTPTLPNGRKDFDGLGAIDIDLFNQNINDLIAGKEVKMPTFDFVEGMRVYKGNTLHLVNDSDILVVEGIHCLNDELTKDIARENKFKVYISALTQLNVDDHSRIPSSDGRLLRRILRDHRTRGTSAERNILMWEDVRNGEAHNIFPYQENADRVFNSALPYEMAVLKIYTEPILHQVGRDSPAYYEARRLLKFLSYFLPLPAEDVPSNSILREFIGNGCFHL